MNIKTALELITGILDELYDDGYKNGYADRGIECEDEIGE